jgi:hypothetical protein
MKYRKLRIAWSVSCGLAAALLIVLWVRSYRWHDNCSGHVGVPFLVIQSSRGELGIGLMKSPSDSYPLWSITSEQADGKRLWSHMEDQPPLSLVGMRYQHFAPIMTLFAVRYWLPVLLTAMLVCVPWIDRATRFSLRTLLIATTAVAAVLGMIIWAAR